MELCKENIFFVYIHRRETDGKIFYVGKGKGRRHLVKCGRSLHWINTVKKHGIIIEKYVEDVDEELALFVELELVDKLLSLGVKLCNITCGGDGSLGKASDETRVKQSLAKLGKKQSVDHAIKSANAKKGKKQPRCAVEKVRKIKSKKVINTNGEIFSSASDAARKFSKKYGVNASQGNISMCCRGERNQAYGIGWSYLDDCDSPEIRKSKSKKVVINITTGERFESVSLAAEWVKKFRGDAKHQGISYAARKGTNAYGFKWFYEKEPAHG